MIFLGLPVFCRSWYCLHWNRRSRLPQFPGFGPIWMNFNMIYRFVINRKQDWRKTGQDHRNRKKKDTTLHKNRVWTIDCEIFRLWHACFLLAAVLLNILLEVQMLKLTLKSHKEVKSLDHGSVLHRITCKINNNMLTSVVVKYKVQFLSLVIFCRNK